MEERMLQAEEADSLSVISPATEDGSEDNSREDGEGAADSLTVEGEELEADGQNSGGEPEGEVLNDASEDGEDGEEVKEVPLPEPPAPTKVTAAPRARFTAIPRQARRPEIGMTGRELCEARDIFHDLSDREIYELYRKVTK